MMPNELLREIQIVAHAAPEPDVTVESILAWLRSVVDPALASVDASGEGLPEPDSLHERVEHYAVLVESFQRKMTAIGPMTPPESIAISGLIAAARDAVRLSIAPQGHGGGGEAVAWRAVRMKGGRSPQTDWISVPVSAWALQDASAGLCTIEYAYLHPATPASAWRPIAEAPRDGTRIMVGNAVGVWMAEWKPVYQSGYQPECPWFSTMLNLDHMPREGRFAAPTHWMPLPTPPTSTKGG